MRLLVLTKGFPLPSRPYHGIHMYQETVALARAGAEVSAWALRGLRPWHRGDLSAMQTVETPELDMKDMHYRTVPGRWFMPLMTYVLRRRLRKAGLLKGARFDAILCHSPVPCALMGLLLREELGDIPVICRVIGSDVNVVAQLSGMRYWTRRILRSVDLVVPVSRALAAQCEVVARCRLPIEVVCTGVDLNTVQSPEAALPRRSELGVGPDERLVCFVGNLVIEKGIRELVRAARQVLSEGDRAQFVLIGAGPLAAEVRAAGSDPVLRGRWHVLGARPHAETMSWIAASDLMVLPTYNEGMPNVVMEALCSGVPVIASSVGGIPDAIEDGVNGLLIPPKDWQALGRAMAGLLSDEPLRKRMAGRQPVSQQRHDRCVVVRKLLQAIENTRQRGTLK